MVSIIAPSAPAGADVIAAGSVSTSFASSASTVGKIPASHVADSQPRLSDFQRRFLERIKSEFKQPLNSVIRMSSSVLSTQVDLHHREQLHITLSSAQTLLTNIDNMLALNDVEVQKEVTASGSSTELAQQAAGQNASEPFQLLAMLDALTDFGAQRAADKLQAIELVISFDPRSPVSLSADFRRLFLVLRNLLDNSIKYTSSGFVLVHAAVVLASTPLDADRPVEAAVLASLKSERKASSKSKQAENAAASEAACEEASSQEYILQVIFKDSGDSSLFPHDAMRVASAPNQESGVYARSNREAGIGVGLRVVRTLVGVMGGSLHVAKPDSSAESGVAYGETDVNSTRGTTITVRVPVRRLTDAAIAAAGFAPPASATASPAAAARAELVVDQDIADPTLGGGGILQLPIALDAHPKQASSRQSPSSQKGRGGKHDSSSDFSSPSHSPQSSPGADRSTSPVWSEEGSDGAQGSLSPLRPFISRSPPVASDVSPSDSSHSSFGFSPRSSGATVAAALSTTTAAAASKFRPVDVVICIELPLLRDVIASFVSLAGARVRIVQSATQVAHAIMQGVDVLVLDAELLASNLELGSLVPSALRAPTALIEVHSLLSTDALMNIGADAPFDPESVGGARAAQAQTQAQGGRRSPTPANASALSKSPPRGSAAGQATGSKSPTRGFGAASKQLMLSGVVRASVAGPNAHLLRHYVFARPIKMSSLLQVLSDYVTDVTRRRFASHA